MAAPSTTKWGSIYGSYARLGINITTTSDNGYVYSTIQIWIWTKYSVSDSNNTLYFDDWNKAASAVTSKGSKSINTTVASGAGWSTSNQQLLATYNNTYARAKTATTRYIYASLANVDRVGVTMYASTTLTVPTLPSHTVKYNANGGSGAPSSQTKWYGSYLTLSTTKPTRTGHSFLGWATSANGSVAYAPGAQYGTDADITLYAVWKAYTYTIIYNANGGSGAPANQTKTYGVALTLSSTKPTRSLYIFKGWGTSSNVTTVAYAAGGSYTTNAGITLYAIWELDYVKPRITGFLIKRCDADYNASDEGTYANVKFNWACDRSVSSITIKYKTSTDDDWTSITVSASGTSGTVNLLIGDGTLSNELIYSFQVTVTDTVDSSTIKSTMSGVLYPIDILAGGNGVGIGKASNVEGAMDIYMQTIVRGSQDASGTKASGQLIIGDPDGYHIAMDNNEIMAKVDATTPGNITINYEGGNVGIGNKDSKISLDGQIYILNAKSISGYNTSGEARRLVEINASNQAVFGYGGYSASEGASYYDGNIVNIRSKGAVYITSPTAGISNRAYGINKVLWSGAYYMTAGHTAPLNEKISAQPHGIVLLFQYYNNGATTGIYTSVFIPKYIIPSSGSIRFDTTLSFSQFAVMGTKALNIYNDKIVGHDANNTSGTGSNIAYNNTKFVLTHVIGV